MIALLANPSAPLVLRVDSVQFRKPGRKQSFSELIWKLHQIIVDPSSHAEEVKVAKHQMLRVIERAKRSPKIPESPDLRRFRPEPTQKIPTRIAQDDAPAAQFSNYRKVT